MARLVAALMGVALLGAGVAAAQELTSSPGDDSALSLGTTTDDATTTVDGTTTDAATTARREAGEDVRGPCDEAEHANDPRCTGAAARDDDSRGHDRGGGDDDDDEDRRGSNSGRG